MNGNAEAHFGQFTIDAHGSQLLAAGEPVHITPKALRVLQHLLQAEGGLVTRQELFASHWPGQVVTDDALTRCIHEIRVVLQESSRKQRYLLTVHSRGYRFVAPVRFAAKAEVGTTTSGSATTGAAIGLSGAASTATTALAARDTPSPDFVGRTNELKRAQQLLHDHSLQGHGVIIEISGEPGIGKSQLALQVAAEARRLGLRVLSAQASEARGAPPFWLWIQILRALGPSLSTANGDRVGSTDIADLLPPVAERPQAASEAPRFRHESARFRIRDAVTRVLCDAARSQPLLLVLEDLHAAESDCLQVLTGLAQAIADVSITVLATYRDVGAANNEAHTQALADLARVTTTRARIPLRGFDIHVVGDLLRRRLRHGNIDRLGELALRKTGGNPLYLNELLALTASDSDAANAFDDSWALDRPETINELLARRMALLSDQCRTVLATAAVLGNEFSARLLLLAHRRSSDDDSAATARAADAVVNAALEEARGQRLLMRTAPTALDAQSGDWCFSHGLMRETLYDQLHRHDRERLHLTIADALQSSATGANEQPAAELALHYLRATPSTGQATRAVEYLGLAANRALDAHAYSEGLTHFMRLRELQLSQADADLGTLCRTNMGAALCHAYCGNPEFARKLAADALKIARTAQQSLLIRDAVLLRCSLEPAYPPNPSLVQLIDEVLVDIGGAEYSTRAQLLAQRGFQHFVLGHVDQHLEDARLALALARRSADHHALEHALATCCHAFAHPWLESEWQAAYDERIALARVHHDVFAEYDARRHRLEHLLQTGERDAVNAELARLLRLIERLDTPAARATALRTRAGLAIADGELDAAWQLAQQAYAEGQASTDAGTAGAVAMLQFGSLLGLRGHTADVADQVENDEIVSHNSLLIAGRIYTQCTTGRRAAALTQLQQLSADRFNKLPRDMTYGLALSNLAISCAVLQDQASARIVLELLRPYAGRGATALIYYTAGCASHYMALLEATLENWPAARKHVLQAIDYNRAMATKLYVCASLKLGAQVLRRLNDASETARAVAFEQEATTLAAAMGVQFSALSVLPEATNSQP